MENSKLLLSITLPLLSIVGACGPSGGPSSPPVVSPTADVFSPDVELEPLSLVCTSEVLAFVATEAIPMSDHEELMDLKHQKYADRGRDMPKTSQRRYRRSIADRLIRQHLLALEIQALAAGDYDEAELAERERVNRQGIKDWNKHLRARGESDATLRELYIADLRQTLILDHRGALAITDEEFDEEFERLRTTHDAPVERVRAWSILIELDPDRSGRATKAELRADAERIAALARDPATELGRLARVETTGMVSNDDTGVGDTGFVTAADMPKAWSQKVFGAKVGEVLVIETQAGAYVVKVQGRWGPGPLPRSAFEQDIMQRLTARKLHDAVPKLEAELRERYEVRDCIAQRSDAEG